MWYKYNNLNSVSVYTIRFYFSAICDSFIRIINLEIYAQCVFKLEPYRIRKRPEGVLFQVLLLWFC